MERVTAIPHQSPHPQLSAAAWQFWLFWDTEDHREPSKRRAAIFHLLPFYVCPSVADILISGLSKALHTVVGTTEGRVSYFLKFSSGIG